MKVVGAGLSLALAVAISGCSSLPEGKSVDYSRMPGSGDNMAQGPGLISDHYSDQNGGGYLVYSNEADSNPLVGTGAAKQQDRGGPQRRNTAASQTAAAPSDNSRSVSGSAAAPSTQQRADYERFREYRRFKQFEDLPSNAPQRQEFQQWQEWKDYRRWRDRQQ